MRLLVLLSSTRPGRIGPALADWITREAEDSQRFGSVELIDLARVNLPFLNEAHPPRYGRHTHEHTKRWSGIVSAADAFVVVTPEYNTLPPPSLVNAIDYLHKEWRWKAAGILSYGGVAGGSRSAQAVKQLLGSLNCFAVHEAVVVTGVTKYIEPGPVFRHTASHSQAAKTMLQNLELLAEGLQDVRRRVHHGSTNGRTATPAR